MNFVERLSLFGAEAKEIPCIKGKGAPTTATEGAVGTLYMDVDTGVIYKCVSVTDGVYAWENVASDVLGKAILHTSQNLTDEQKAQARENIGADLPQEVAPRAKVKQIRFYTDAGEAITFEAMYAFDNVAVTSPWNRSQFVYGLEAHAEGDKKQRIFRSMDGGETWSEYASLPIDATHAEGDDNFQSSGVWYTDIYVDAYDAQTNNERFCLMKTTRGFGGGGNVLCTFVRDAAGTGWWNNGSLEMRAKRWLGNNNSIATASGKNSAGTSVRATIFGEYGITTNGETYSLWRTTNHKDWTKVLEINGDHSGVTGSGEIRHWHGVFVDPYTKHWWACAGDIDGQCRIYRSKDMGDNWELLFSGSQRERTCSFVFEKDCIYYGMDSTNKADKNSIKIVRIDKEKLDTDRENAREDVAVVDSAFAVYGLTRTAAPEGFVVWAQQEPYSLTPGRYVLEFYDYGTKKMYPIARFDTSGISNDKYIGFYAGARVQNALTGTIFAHPTPSMQHEKYGYSVSTHVKIELTC